MANENDFSGKGRPLTDSEVTDAADRLSIPSATFWAIMSVESRGFGFLSDRRPKILFERHIFHERTDGRYSKDHPDISNPKPGGYGASGAHQYDRLNAAIALDRQAALESASWGLGQVMGFNAKPAGFQSAEEMVTAMMDQEDQQMAAMANFIIATQVSNYLKDQQWTDFAAHYNGLGYQQNKYDTKLEAAYNLYTLHPAPDLKIRTAQAALFYLGFPPGNVDGVFGIETQSALIRFQKSKGVTADGKLSDAIFEQLTASAFPP